MRPFAHAIAFAAALAPIPASADHCVKPVVAVGHHNNVVAVPFLTPLYGASYVGDADADTQRLLEQLLAEIRALRNDLKRPGPAAPPGDPGDDGPPVPPLKAIDVVALVKTKCASCHTGESAAKGFEMVTEAGDLVKLNGLSRQAVIAHTTGQKGPPMPPPNKPQMTPAEKEALRRALTDPIPAAKK